MAISQPNLVLDWSVDHAVGIAQFDAEHQVFFRLVRKLYEAMKNGTNRATVGALLGEIYTYSATHMTHEEEVLERCGFPQLEEHRSEHAQFRARLREYMDQYDRERSPVALSLLQFLQEWLDRHLKQFDSRYAEFLHAKGMG